jgi:hypothetical protein
VTALSATEIVAVRGVEEGFAATATFTVPAPVPPPAPRVIHDTGDRAVHAQPAPAVTQTLLDEVPPLRLIAVGVIEYSHAPVCVTMNDLPAMVTDPMREPEVVFAATERPTVPGPVPLGVATVTHDAADQAVQAQSAFVARPTETLEAAGPTVTELLESDEVHELPACVTVKPKPPMISVPTRANDAVFAATE